MIYFCPSKGCTIESYSKIGEKEPHFKFCPLHGRHLIGKRCETCGEDSRIQSYIYCKTCGKILTNIEA